MEETKMKTKKEVNFTIYNPQKWLVLLTNNPKIYWIDFEDVCKANGDIRYEITTRDEVDGFEIIKRYKYEYVPSELDESHLERESRNRIEGGVK
tara:strand:+ start:617 stop:898 length:282 start_codon:yes stop_codon:yes gene_type:complete